VDASGQFASRLREIEGLVGDASRQLAVARDDVEGFGPRAVQMPR
jgi:hypothetical protein